MLLREQVAALTAQVQALQERLHRDSSNSSRPPSSDPPWKPKPSRAKPRGRKRGGQPGHPGQQRAWVAPAALTGRHEYFPVVCEHCQADLPAQTPLLAAVRAHQVYELPEIRPEIAEHVRRGCCCPRCGRHTWAPLPPGVPPSGSGPRFQAVVALLTGKGQMSRLNV